MTDPSLNPYAASSEAPEATLRRRSNGRVWLLAATAMILLLAVTAVVSFLLGAVVAETGAYHRRSARLMEQAQQVLDQHPDRFSRVTVEEGSAGRAFLSGSVRSQEDYDHLEAEMQRVFGEETGREMTRPVEIAPKA